MFSNGTIALSLWTVYRFEVVENPQRTWHLSGERRSYSSPRGKEGEVAHIFFIVTKMCNSGDPSFTIKGTI